MSEFERIDDSGAWADARELQFPGDFSAEEAAFARQMRELFAIDSEELPPFFVQTLLDEEHYPIPSVGFEQRVTAEAFGRLHLTRGLPPESHPTLLGAPLLQSHRPTLLRRARMLFLAAHDYFRRPLAVGVSLLTLLLAVAVVFATPSFAQSLRVILANTGTVQLKNAPTTDETSKLSKSAGLVDPDVGYPSIPLFWLGKVASNYDYAVTHLQDPTKWSKGAIVDIQYSLPLGTSLGDGMLDIREFQIASAYSAVLQVVEDGSATSVTLKNGEPAVYVNGMWAQRLLDHTLTYQWQSGTRCMLIMELQGVVIWMVGDPRDGLTVQTMAAIADQLVPVNQATLMFNYRGMLVASSSLIMSVNNPVGSECYLLVQQGISPASGAGDFVFSSSGTDVVPGPGG